MATRMLQRRGTAAAWAAQNPVLSAGEIGFETDTKVLKMGDGVNAWNDLQSSYLSTGGGPLNGDLNMQGNRIIGQGAMVNDLDMGNNNLVNVGDILNPGMIGPLSDYLDMNGNPIANVATPVTDDNAAHKGYVDSVAKILVGYDEESTSYDITSNANGTVVASLSNVPFESGEQYEFLGRGRFWNNSGASQMAEMRIEVDGTTIVSNRLIISSGYDESQENTEVYASRLSWTSSSTAAKDVDLVVHRRTGAASLKGISSAASPTELRIRKLVT